MSEAGDIIYYVYEYLKYFLSTNKTLYEGIAIPLRCFAREKREYQTSDNYYIFIVDEILYYSYFSFFSFFFRSKTPHSFHFSWHNIIIPSLVPLASSYVKLLLKENKNKEKMKHKTNKA